MDINVMKGRSTFKSGVYEVVLKDIKWVRRISKTSREVAIIEEKSVK